jgi:hypothetical protein
MTKNKELRTFIGCLLIGNIGNIFYQNIISLLLIEKGISQETLTNISTILIPFEIYLSFHFTKKSDFLKIYMSGFKSLIFFKTFQLIFIESLSWFNYKELLYSNYLIFVIMIFMSFIQTIIYLQCSNGLGGFFQKISDKKLGATYITALNSFNNLSYKWPGIFIFWGVDYFGYRVVGLISIFYCIIFYALSRSTFNYLDECHEELWQIKEETDKKIN